MKNSPKKIYATLLFIIQGNKVLLIHKKTGIGMGKINGPGGKIEPGETGLEAICREAHEELCISPINPEKKAELFFEMSDMEDIHCQVFTSTEFEGNPIETREAKPFWCEIEEIPWEKMWEDDKYWLPSVLNGQNLCAHFCFEGEKLIAHSVEMGKSSWLFS